MARRARRVRVALIGTVLALAPLAVAWFRRRAERPSPVVSERSAPPARTAPKPAATEEAAAPADDLTRIKGVGAVLQDYLAARGITTFRQIARLSEDEINRLQEHMPGFPDRIRRDRWVDQARSLHLEEYGREP